MEKDLLTMSCRFELKQTDEFEESTFQLWVSWQAVFSKMVLIQLLPSLGADL